MSNIWEGFAPEPTVFKGGIKRMIEIWETLREQNAGGYGGSVVQQIGSGKHKWGIHPNKTKSTSCSPFTATVIGMLFDPSGATKGDTFDPVYDNGTKPLPSSFYSMHNGFFLEFKDHKAANATTRYFCEQGWNKYCNDSAGSIQFFNLGYPIEARDLRRGDMVGIDWSNNGGHAVFIWDVHLDADGNTDAFCFVSANGSKLGPGNFFGNGITIGGCDGKTYLTGSPTKGEKIGNLTKVPGTLFEDRPSHIADAHWYACPGIDQKDIDRSTFKDPGHSYIVDFHVNPKPPKPGHKPSKFPCHVRSIVATRLWGIQPPTRDPGNARLQTLWEQARKLAYEDPPASYATGKGTAPAVHVERAPVTVTKKPEPEQVKKDPPKKAAQHDKRPTEHQLFVEHALQKLFAAGWIDKDPGKSDDVNDAATKDAIKDFQTKFDVSPVNGIGGPDTRKALHVALDDLAKGLPKPSERKPPKPVLTRVAWLRNRIDVGGEVYLAFHGDDLHLLEKLEITLKDAKSGASEKIEWTCRLHDEIGTHPVRVPKSFKRGAALTASFQGKGKHADVKLDYDVPLYIGLLEKLELVDDEWPWDDTKWTQKMRDIADELRATKAPSGPFEHFEITQYGVKERIEPGDVEVKSASGKVYGKVSRRSLMLADIEGTMRLNGRILNITHAGNVYEPREVMVNGKKVTKNKPNPDKFDAAKSLWTDVTDRAPWGSGSRTPLVPFRTLAINPKLNPTFYYKKVYIKQLDGMQLPTGETHNGVCICGDAGGMRKTHFDLFVGREDHHVSLASVGVGDARICEIQLLDDCGAAKKK